MAGEGAWSDPAVRQAVHETVAETRGYDAEDAYQEDIEALACSQGDDLELINAAAQPAGDTSLEDRVRALCGDLRTCARQEAETGLYGSAVATGLRRALRMVEEVLGTVAATPTAAGNGSRFGDSAGRDPGDTAASAREYLRDAHGLAPRHLSGVPTELVQAAARYLRAREAPETVTATPTTAGNGSRFDDSAGGEAR